MRLGRQRFGEPDAAVRATVEAITDVQHLERLLDHVLVATNWQDLLATT